MQISSKMIQVRRRKFIAEKDAKEATQVAQMPRNQVQVKQIMFKEPKLRRLFRMVYEYRSRSRIEEIYEW